MKNIKEVTQFSLAQLSYIYSGVFIYFLPPVAVELIFKLALMLVPLHSYPPRGFPTALIKSSSAIIYFRSYPLRPNRVFCGISLPLEGVFPLTLTFFWWLLAFTSNIIKTTFYCPSIRSGK